MKRSIIATVAFVAMSSSAMAQATPPAAAPVPPAAARPATPAPAPGATTAPAANVPAAQRPATPGIPGGGNTADDRVEFNPASISAINAKIAQRHQECIAKGRVWRPPHTPGEVNQRTGKVYTGLSLGTCKAPTVNVDTLPPALRDQVRAFVKR